MTGEYRKAKEPIEGAAILRLTFSARGEIDDPNFKAIYGGVLQDLGLSDDQVREYIRKHKPRLVEVLRKGAPRAGG